MSAPSTKTRNLHPSFDAVISALKSGGYAPTRSGLGYTARCPSHDDHNPSLTIGEGKDGTALINCFSAGCSYESVIQALGLWTDPKEGSERRDEVPYHVRKQVGLYAPAHLKNNNLIVPCTDLDGNEKGFIEILPKPYKHKDSGKWIDKLFRGKNTNEWVFLFGATELSQLANCNILLVATGYSTAASIYEAGRSIVIMVTCDNAMLVLIPKLRAKFPDKTITICADYDARERFTSLAFNQNARLCCPGIVNGNLKSDFNDLMIASGGVAVTKAIISAKEVPAESVITESVSVEPEKPQPEKRIHQSGITGAELLAKKFAAISWVVPNILPDVGAYLLAGKQKMGKSWFSLALSLAYTQGGKFLNQDIPKGKVLYLGLEDSERRMQSRILTLQPDIDQNPSILNNIRFFHGTDNVPRLDNGFFEFIDPYLEGVRLMVIDILQKIRPMKGSGNVYADDYNALGAIQTFAIERNMCILVLHHTRKADADDVFDTLNGSGGVGGAVDGALIIARKRNEGSAILSTTGRDIPELEHGLMFKDGFWTYAGSAAEVRATGEQNEVFSHIADAGSDGVTVAELCETLGKNEPAIRKLLRKLGESGRIRKRDTKPAPHYSVCDGPLSGGYSPNVTPP